MVPIEPERISLVQAKNGGRGVTVLIHEMAVPAETRAMQAQHLPRPLARGADKLWDDSVDRAIALQDSATGQRAEVLEFGTLPVPQIYGAESLPKYHCENGLPDPYAQVDRTREIQAVEQTYCRSGY
jgi:hypothetical protein